jgi:hypothetical protein
MRHRREFIRDLTSGLLGAGALVEAAPSGTRREVRVGGKRVKVVDVHAHATLPGVADLVQDGWPLLSDFLSARVADLRLLRA